MSTATSVREARQFASAQSRYDNLAEPDEPESCQSLQPLGDARVMVDYIIDSYGCVDVLGAWVEADFVEADCFSDHTLGVWHQRISDEIAAEAAL